MLGNPSHWQSVNEWHSLQLGGANDVQTRKCQTLTPMCITQCAGVDAKQMPEM